MKKVWFWVMLPLLAGGAFFCWWFWKSVTDVPAVPGSIAAKAEALLLSDKESIESTDISAYGQGEGQWYLPYLAWLYENDFLPTDTILVEAAEEPLTYGAFLSFLEKLGQSGLVKVPYARVFPDLPVPENVFWDIYRQLVAERSDCGIETVEFTVIGTPGYMEGLEEWQAMTDSGQLGFVGLELESYLDLRVKGFVKDRELICLTEVASTEITYENVLVTGSDPDSLDIFFDGMGRALPGKEIPQGITNIVADVTMDHQQVSYIGLKKESIREKVLSVGESYIELEHYGKVPVTDDFCIYKIYGTIEMQDSSAILPGYSIQQFVVADGIICAALTVQAVEASNIRVLIRNTGYESIWHEDVTITCEEPFRVKAEDWEQAFGAGEVVELTPGHEWLEKGRLVFTCDSYAGELEISSIERSRGKPTYQGSLEVARGEEGLLIVNELLMENYLCRVVPSEMPSTYGAEALKAQAVCARTYAFGHILKNACRQYGAHVDDSTTYQVYNNIGEQPSTTRAVQDTYGDIAVYGGEVIEALYYSTGWGVSADVGIWGGDQSLPYLVSKDLSMEQTGMDYTEEGQFRARVDDVREEDFDSGYPWYRWQFEVDGEELADSMNQKLASYQLRDPEAVSISGVEVVDGDTVVFENPVTSVSVAKRLAGGSVQELVVESEGVQVTVKGQSAIRQLLGNEAWEYQKNDGSTASMDSMPSAFFYVVGETGADGEGSEEGTTVFTVKGGAYGHGVGMSQNGAACMADLGMTYEEILGFFYEGVEISGLY